MKKSSAVLVLIVMLSFLAVMAYAVRLVINFNAGAPLSEYISHADLLAMTYDLLYYSAWVIALLCGVIIILLIYLVLLIESIIEEIPAESPKQKPRKRLKPRVKKKEKPTWPPQEEPD